MTSVRSETKVAYAADTHSDDQLIEKAKALLLTQLRGRRLDAQPMTSPANVRDYLQLQLAARPYEAFCVMFLDTQHRLQAFEELFHGTLDSASVYPREVARRALSLGSGAVIFAHNHPSGVAEPSDADRKITDRLKEALGLLEIRVLDHIVVGEETVSFAERGWL